MKKKIANGLELFLLLVSFIILWLPTLTVTFANYSGDVTANTHAFGLMTRGSVYIIFFLYAVTALMCIISILVNREHRDGKMHVIMPVLLFLYAVSQVKIDVGTIIGEFVIVESRFPIYLFLLCLLGVFIISIAKRSTIIAGIPTVKMKSKSSQADELKKYKELLDSGAITQEEYDQKKKEFL